MIQGKANDLYGGGKFPSPDSKLTRTVYTTLPNVNGHVDLCGEEEAAGCRLRREGRARGRPTEGKGIIARQSPGARAAGGATVTINPSNGSGIEIPNVQGMPIDQAIGRQDSDSPT